MEFSNNIIFGLVLTAICIIFGYLFYLIRDQITQIKNDLSIMRQNVSQQLMNVPMGGHHGEEYHDEEYDDGEEYPEDEEDYDSELSYDDEGDEGEFEEEEQGEPSGGVEYTEYVEPIPIQQQEHSVNYSVCESILKSGKNKGKPCGKPANEYGVCAKHTPHIVVNEEPAVIEELE